MTRLTKVHNTFFLSDPVDCIWGSWSAWGAPADSCSKQCGEGIQERKRSISHAALYGGKDCLGSDLHAQFCEIQACTGLKLKRYYLCYRTLRMITQNLLLF